MLVQPMLLRAATLLSLLLLSGCFLGYDSRWGQAARSQKAAAAEAKPGELRATPSGSPTGAVSVQRVRAYVASDYAAQITDERARITRIIEDANDVIGPTLALRLELDEVRPWDEGAGDLDDALAALETTDAASDVGWVIGFVGRHPTLRTDFTELGNARMHGRHFVMRAMNDAAEYDAINKRFDELDEAQRRELYKKRVQHKEVAVFLHELGHTLGVPHEVAEATLMHSHYARDATSFSEEAAGLMRLTLLRRLDPEAMSAEELSSALADRVRGSASRWVAEERDAWLAGLGSTGEVAGAMVSAVGVPEDVDDKRWRDLAPKERKAYLEAIELEEQERYEEAWQRVSPLFAAHPGHYEVQDLRCRLAMKRGGDPDELERQCAAFGRLDAKGR